MAASGCCSRIVIGIVNVFLLPAEVGNMYASEGKEKPVSGKTGWWFLLPLVGGIVWVVKVQENLNRFWESHSIEGPGAAAA